MLNMSRLEENFRVSEPYIDLKISTGIKPATDEFHPAVREDRAYRRIKEKMKFTEKRGPAWIRAEHEPFEIIGNDGSQHLCRPQKAVVMTLEDTLYHNRRSGYVRLPTLEWFAGITLCSVMEALDFLHNEAHITHCSKRNAYLLSFNDVSDLPYSKDITAGNIIFAASKAGGEEVFSTFLGEPPHSKVVGPDGRMVFVSQALDWFEFRDHIIGRILSNYGEARIGPPYPHELVQPEPYRAPEIIMGAEWSHAVDIWNLGCLVNGSCSTPLPSR
ncbi:hypothetical protein MPH_02624 [Macrophomina phaseolina MS6]|uniref:Protein kinase domain-containing protein n=1 Tax=Macrophomina phaseolina (strain MS6) TaxID=1126212 RepID=K2STQ3_MACPH|nr:hypothetical protein MPH_02624 [Macrophomina phaseolina MS6]